MNIWQTVAVKCRLRGGKCHLQFIIILTPLLDPLLIYVLQQFPKEALHFLFTLTNNVGFFFLCVYLQAESIWNNAIKCPSSAVVLFKQENSESLWKQRWMSGCLAPEIIQGLAFFSLSYLSCHSFSTLIALNIHGINMVWTRAEVDTCVLALHVLTLSGRDQWWPRTCPFTRKSIPPSSSSTF